ncbi:MAG: hypothetical protein OQJ89_13875 [Kangiellaceae bacterium]|nr:hypothetical protein [Kangiellaceae bacterium]MCW9018054.1 hypothetical protein [Kangiellaceae bacterium]
MTLNFFGTGYTLASNFEYLQVHKHYRTLHHNVCTANKPQQSDGIYNFVILPTEIP